MSWQLLIGLSVLLFSFGGILYRVVMQDVDSDAFAQTLASYALGGIFSLMIVMFRGGFHSFISFGQIPFFVLITIFSVLAPTLRFKAAQSLEASESSILLSSQKLWEVVLAFIFLQEAFSLNRLLGTIIVLLGIAVAQWRKERFVLNQESALALLAAVSFAGSEITAYFVVRDFDPASLNVYVALFTVIAILCTRPKTCRRLAFYLRPRYSINIVIVSFTGTLAGIFLYTAYQIERNASQLAPLMAAEGIITVLLGMLFLKERSNMVQKISGAIIVLIGIRLLF